MQYTTQFDSPLGKMLLAADEKGITGLWFYGEKYFADGLAREHKEEITPALKKALQWLKLYFDGKKPQFMPPIHMMGTIFQMSVWNILQTIPYGKTTTYGAIAKKIAAKRGTKQMSAQAVGGAVGHNKISILIPCHRVLGSNGDLTGYAAGIDKKKALLQIEDVKFSLL